MRRHGEVQPGIRWGPFTLRIPFVHARPEWPELVQGILVAGATGLAVVPLYTEYFGMDFETAVAMVIVQSLILCSSPILFGEPFCPGWLTPALPLILREALLRETVPERIEYVTAVVLAVGAVFLFFGVSGLGPFFVRWVPRSLKAAIILGAGLSAIYKVFEPASGGRPSYLESFPVGITLATGVTLLLLFSRPLEKWKVRARWIGTLSGLGMAPGFLLAMALGALPFVGEVSYAGLSGLFCGPDGGFRLGFESLVFLPDFASLWEGYSPFARGFPGPAVFLEAVPLALAAYVIGFGDIVTATEIVRHAGADRPDEKVPFDERRTHLSVGVRNVLQGLVAGPFFPLQGPLWTGAMVVVAERWRRGRRAMDSLYGGIFSYYVFGLPVLFFVRPFLELFRPVLVVSLALTLLLTGFACAYVALGVPRGRIERGVAVVSAMIVMYYSTALGVVVGLALALLLLGREAWAAETEGN